MKKILFVCLSLFLFSLQVFSQEIPDSLDRAVPGVVKVLRDIQATMYPPEIHKVSISPEKPTENEDIEVVAEIYNDWNVTDDETVEAYIYYSTDEGKSWEEVEMEQDGNDDKKWVAVIPGQKSGTKIIYYLTASDSSGNVITELPCKVTNWPPTKEKPELCLFKGAKDDDPVDDEAELIKDDLDIMETYVGYDDDAIYLKTVVQGKVDQGSASPMKINAYAGIILNPDKGSASNILTQLIGAAHAPLAKMAGYDPCLSIYTRTGSDIVVGQEGVSCKADESNLYIRIDNSVIGKNPSKKLKLISGVTATVTSISSEPYGQLGDYVRLTTIVPNEREINVE